MIINSALENILRTATDISTVCELYSSDTTPTADGFDPANAIDCFAKVNGIIFRTRTYKRLVEKFGTINRTINEKTNTASVTFNNLTREISNFEFTHGFEGLILVIRLISRSRSIDLSDSQILFVGRCEQPKSGTKERLTVSANFILSSLDTEIPRRKFSPDDQEGRTPSDPLFEGFRFIPQYGVTTYSVRERRGGFLGLIGFKKTVTKNLQWSSYSDLDIERSVPEGFGRVQAPGIHLAYQDSGTSIYTATAFLEGQIQAYTNLRSVSSQFPITEIFYRFGKLGGVDEQTLVPNGNYPGRAFYSRTAYAHIKAAGTAADTIDPAPEIAAVILAKILTVPDGAGSWASQQWSDNAAAVTRFVLTSQNYYKLDPNWIDDASFFEAYKFNDQIIFDLSYSDLIFVPSSSFSDSASLNDGEMGNYFLPTSSVRADYFKYLKGEIAAEQYFLAAPPTAQAYDSIIPIEPPDDEEPGPGGGSSRNLFYYLRRRYTCNVLVTEQMKAIDFLHKVVFPSSRMFFTQGANGKIKLNHKKPVDWALATAAISSSTIALDDVSMFMANPSGHLLIDPNTTLSEIRDISAVNYSLSQNSATLAASANISIAGFSGCNGSNIPATATLTVTSTNANAVSNFMLDGEQIKFAAVTNDTTATVASFITASINANPRMQRKFVATVAGNVVTVQAKFGTLTLSGAPEFTHAAPLANPTAAPVLTAASGGTFAAGVYRVAYAYENSHGQTLVSPFASVTLTANQKINVSAVSLPSGASNIVWFTVPAENSSKLRFHSKNNGSAFSITSLPLLTAALPRDLNRTGTEVLRVSAVFSDRGSVRTNLSRSNVLKASYEWILGNREKAVNRIDIKFRDSTQDWRLIEFRLRDDAHIAKTKKISNLEINGQAIDNFNQAYRVASSILAELRDADFFERWSATREALLLEEGDVVAVTDDGAGFVNLPVRIEEITIDADGVLPKVSFVARKYSTTLHDDSVAERQIPVITETTTAASFAANREVEYYPSNFTDLRALDATSGDINDLANVVATLMDDLNNNRK